MYKSKDTDIAQQISAICRAVVSSVTLYPYESDWREDLIGQIASHHVVIAVVDRDFFKHASAVFAAGYIIGKEVPLILFGKERYRLPEFFKGIPATTRLRLLSGILRNELDKSEFSEIRRQARKALKDMGVSFTTEAFIKSVKDGWIEAVEQFLKAGFSADLEDDKGVPLICLATRNKHRLVVKKLIQAGASVNAVSRDRGNSALMDAAAEGAPDILEDLINAGADLDIKSKSGQTALILAVGQQNEEIASMLINAGASVEEKDNLGMSAEKYARLFKLTSLLDLMGLS